MTYASWITKMRNQVGDTRRRVHVDWTGDGSTTVFQMPTDTFPVLDQTGTYVIKVNGTPKTEGSDFSLDKEAGTLVLSSAPSNGQAVTLDASAVYVTDASWLEIINDVIRSLGDDFFKEVTDETTYSTTANMLSLDISDQPWIAVYDAWFRTSSSDDWMPFENFVNWRYSRGENKIYVGLRDAFTVTGYAIKIKGLKGYVLGDAVTDDIDVQDKYMTIIEAGCTARFWRYRYKNVVQLVSKMSTEATRTPLQELIMLADRSDRLYETEKLKLKPGKPARKLPVYIEGGGRP